MFDFTTWGYLNWIQKPPGPNSCLAQEALTLHDLRLGGLARESFADGLARLPTKRLRSIAEVGDMLQDENHKARAD